jgi:flagellar protein FlaG
MSSDIKQVSPGGLLIRPQAAPAPSNGAHRSDSAPAVKPAPKLELPTKAKISFDPVKVSQSVREAVSLLNEQLSSNKTGIGFTVNDGGGTPIVTVRNTKTGEVVRQIPNEVVIKIAQNFEAFKGSLADKKT